MPDLFSDRGAIISPCGRYRYNLWRVWDHDLPRVLWVMLNPSTADAEMDDPTIRKCVGFARRWGFGSIEVVNLFAWRCTDPRDLPGDESANGPDRDRYWLEAAGRANLTVAGWGAHVSYGPTIGKAMSTFADMDCLGFTASGQPRHPLMLGYATDKVPLVRGGAIVEVPLGAA